MAAAGSVAADPLEPLANLTEQSAGIGTWLVRIATGPNAVVTAAQRVLDDAGMSIDYLEVRGDDCEPLTSPGAARLFIACLVGTTRLIDNCAVEVGSV